MFRMSVVGWAHCFAQLASLLIALNPILCQAEFKDPTKPAYSPISTATSDVKPEPKLELSAIWQTASGKWATINNVRAKKGQVILDNVKIIKISRKSVSVIQNGTRKTLQLLQPPSNTP